ncbi:MAG TPA: hypothetical protein VF179_29485 [Thermoanaerobaculia bacterium]|nr:hypothetical protein [Thermoanaerobaculia bacterium]
MIILDENIPESQWQLLRSWRIRALLIGRDISEKGITDENLASFLIQQPRPTFFTRDEGFYDKTLCHARYCLVYLAVRPNESASFAWRLLRHPLFKTRAQRLGAVIRASSAGLQVWRLRESRAIFLAWSD